MEEITCICSAPEIFQRRMKEIIEDLEGVEVIADDFLIIGYGETDQEASSNHDNNLKAFLKTCRKNNLKLNWEKIKWKKIEVQYIGHTTTSRGLKPVDGKISAIQKMPTQIDKTGVRRFLGMINYLDKFLPKLADKTKELRKLTEKKTVWQWGTAEENEFNDLKNIVTSTEILRYYDVKKDITIQ